MDPEPHSLPGNIPRLRHLRSLPGVFVRIALEVALLVLLIELIEGVLFAVVFEGESLVERIVFVVLFAASASIYIVWRQQRLLVQMLQERGERERLEATTQQLGHHAFELEKLMNRLQHEIAERKAAQAALEAREEATRRFRDYLWALHDISIDLGQTATLDALYRRAIELGRSHLGFDRLGLFLLDEETRMMLGTYGVDPTGQLRNESHLRRPLADDPRAAQVIADQELMKVWEDAPLYEAWESIGRGWSAMALLWNGDKGVGWLATDNLIRREPLSTERTELLLLYAITLGHLITQKQTEAALRESEARQRLLLGAIPSPIIAFNPELIVLYCNAAYASLLDRPVEQVEGQSLLALIPDFMDRPLYKAGVRALRTGKMEEIESYYRDRYYLIRVYPAIWGLLGTAIDLTEHKQAEQRAVELALERERARILTQFIKDASHEFRTPLSIIQTSAGLVPQASTPERQQKIQTRITEQVAIILALIEGMVAITQLESRARLATTRLVLRNLLEEAMLGHRRNADAKGQTVRLTHDAALPPVEGDADLLFKALGHLLDNAIRFTPAAGTIEIHLQQRGDMAEIVVQDTGVGLSEAEKKRIFEHFYRTDQAHTTRGLGLGLPLVKRIIEAHHGKIEVESTPGQGSSFRVLLPFHQPALPSEETE